MSHSLAARRLANLAILPLAFALGVGCGSNSGQLDLSDVPNASWGEAYTGQLAVVRVESNGSLSSYDGPASFAPGDGALPEGLSMNEAGAITGTPTEVGSFNQQVWVSNLNGIESFLDQVSIEVIIEGAFIGHERDQLTQITDLPGDRQSDMWMRVADGGEQGMQEYTADVGIYMPGPNNVAEAGYGDDVRVGALDPSEVTVTLGPWEEIDETDPRPGYPSGHYNEGSPVVHTGGFTFVAGSDTGEMDVTFTHETYGMDSTKIMVVPPDWCPLGFQEGSDWDNGSCEP